MAEENNNAQEKTEQPTQRRLDKAKEDGKTVTSREMYVVTSIIVMLGFLYFVSYNFNNLSSAWKSMFYLLGDNREEVVFFGLKSTFTKIVIASIIIGVPTVTFTILTQLLVGGITFSFKSIEWKNSKIDPIKGLKRIFSVKGLVEMAKGILKVILLFGAGSYLIFSETKNIINITKLNFEDAVVAASSFFPALLLVLIVALSLIGALDWMWQRFSHLKSLRMNRQDLKDESKQAEGSPEVKAKIRRLQLETVRKAVKQAESVEEVNQATAVIVNPTHFAVALKYDVGSPGAPKVLSMGRGKIAQKIISKAEESNITIFRHKLLARALFFTSEIGSEISEKLYTAVAIALAYIYKVNNEDSNVIEPDIEIPEDLIFNEDGTQTKK